MFRFTKINEIFDKQNSIFNQIDELNSLLKDILPQHLLCSAHIGAIDHHKNIVVLFVNSSEVLHLVKFHSDNILDHFQKHNYAFDNLLIKVSQRQNILNQSNNKSLNDMVKL